MNLFYNHAHIPHRAHLTELMGRRAQQPIKRRVLSSDAAVQTEVISINGHPQSHVFGARIGVHDAQESIMTASELASILKWSKEISSDINLSSGTNINQFPDLTLMVFSFSPPTPDRNRHR